MHEHCIVVEGKINYSILLYSILYTVSNYTDQFCSFPNIFVCQYLKPMYKISGRGEKTGSEARKSGWATEAAAADVADGPAAAAAGGQEPPLPRLHAAAAAEQELTQEGI